jgi:glycerol-3-phosphate dehydrogenase
VSASRSGVGASGVGGSGSAGLGAGGSGAAGSGASGSGVSGSGVSSSGAGGSGMGGSGAGRDEDTFDVVVIGGGIHGAGVLQAAAAAGHRALLLEEREPAAGTSSRSSKLVHGGLRYLETFQLGLVRESLAERTILLRVAPGLVRLVPFHVPVYRDTSRRPWKIRAGLSLYALLGNLARDARFESLPRTAWGALDGLSTDGLEAVFRYQDGQTDDKALVRAVIASAESLGARAIAPARFAGATREGEGYEVRWVEGASVRTCRARVLVNAGGPWIDEVRKKIAPEPPGFEVDLIGGAHVEIEGTIEHGIYYTEAPGDHRAVFVMPWKGRTLVGTTETPYRGDPAAVQPLPSEIEYLRGTFAHYFPSRESQVVGAWAGLRVLPRSADSPFVRRRDTTLVCDDERAPRTVAIYGGKLTGYRATAEKVMRLLARTLPERKARGDTRELAIG